LNRRGFEVRTETILQDMRRQRRTLALVLCDLDHFKHINDTYGHSAGDRTIVAFAELLDRSVTIDHVAGRIGGEEFAIALPRVNLPAARLFAEGARSAFAALPIPGQPDVRCEASFGVAEIEDTETFEELMRRADAALYGAKRKGRNQVRTAIPRPVDMGRTRSA
jgi:diguanylate cyclase (GGDEF)-like protein